MFKRLAVLVLIAHLPACAGELGRASAPVPQPCSDAWYRLVEASLPTGDGQGHGPDPGSDEWKSVIEFRLGIRGKAGVPAPAALPPGVEAPLPAFTLHLPPAPPSPAR